MKRFITLIGLMLFMTVSLFPAPATALAHDGQPPGYCISATQPVMDVYSISQPSFPTESPGEVSFLSMIPDPNPGTFIKTTSPVLLCYASADIAPPDVPPGDSIQHDTISDTEITPVKDLPPEGAGIGEWFKWLIGIIGFSTIVRVFFRFVPTAVDIDWVGYLIKMLDYLLGKWIPNRSPAGEKDFK